MQHTHYAHRGTELVDISLFEYPALIQIVGKQTAHTKETTDHESQTSAIEETATEPESQTSIFDQPAEAIQPPPQKKSRKKGGGRPANKTFEFHPAHPLHGTHVRRLNSKMKIPMIYGRVPSTPSPRPDDEDEIFEAWENNAEKFARFFLTLFRQWTHSNGTTPGPVTYDDFCEFMFQLETGSDENGPTYVDTARRRWIETTAHGLKVYALYRTIAQRYRGIAATEWGKRDWSSAFPTEEENSSEFTPSHPTHNQQNGKSSRRHRPNIKGRNQQ